MTDHSIDSAPTTRGDSLGVPLHVQSRENENIPYTSSPSAPLVLPPASLGHISNPGGARRSTRGWQPSAAALENIASNVTEVDALFAASESEPSQEGSASDWLFAVGEKRVPRSDEQILSLPQFEKDKWLAACKEESNSHLSIPSISGVLHPSEFTAAAPIRLSWVFTIKPTGEYKARIVMLGQHMREGVHYNNTHAPVPSPTLIRLFFALIAADARDFTQLDIKTAFLTAPLDIELDVILPNGFGRGEERDHVTPDSKRRRALTAIPGCPQGTRVWRQKLMRDLNSLGFFGICPTEPCFLKESVDEDHIFGWISLFPLQEQTQVFFGGSLFKLFNACIRMVSKCQVIMLPCTTVWVLSSNDKGRTRFVFIRNRFSNRFC